MSVQAWFSNDDVVVDPGSTLALQLSVHNLGESTDSFTIVPSGLTASWVTVSRSTLTLFGDSQDVIDVEVVPPKVPTTTAGPSVVAVRVIPNEDPDDTVVAEATLDVRPFDDRRLVALQPVLRARRRANYEFMVENHGNGLASCRLRLIDPTERIDGSFDPPAVGVAPGGASLVQLKARARRGVFRRSTRTLDFEIEAEQPGHDPAATPLSLVQPPTIPGTALARLAVVAALVGAAALAWFGVVRPEIRDAVDERIDEVAPAETTVDQDTDDPATGDPAPATTVAPTETPQAVEQGEPTFRRLTAAPAVTQTASDTFTVPDGRLFDLTDVRIENRGNDIGRAALQINGDEAFVWSLGNIRGSLFEPRITPIRLQPGDNVTFSVRCDLVGDQIAGTCVNAINLGGRVIEVDEI